MNFVPEILLVFSAVFLIFFNKISQRDYLAHILAALTLGIAFFWRAADFGQAVSFGGFFVLDGLAWYLDLIYLGVGLAAVIISGRIKKDQATFFSLLFFGILGMMLLTKSRDLLAFFLSVELIALSLYSLVAFGKEERKLEGAVKYFVLNIFASALLIFGIGIIFALSNATQFDEIRHNLITRSSMAVLVGIVFMIAGLGFKMGVFPFNFWIPDVYEAAPVGITTILAGASKKAAFGAMMLVLILPLGGFAPFWAGLFSLLAVGTLMFGHLGALWQDNFRRFMAYSIIGQSGFMMIGLAAPTVLGLTGMLFHILTHAIAVIGIFAIIAFLESKNAYEVRALDGLGKRAPFLAVALTVFFASLGGVPLLAGFASKFVLLSAAVSSGQSILALFAIFASVISIFFYFKIAMAMFSGKTQAKPFKVPIITTSLISVSLILIVLFGVFPGPIIGFLTQTINNLF